MDCQEIVMNGRDFLKLNIMQKKYNFIIIMPEVQRSFFTQQEKLELIISIMLLQMNFQLFVGNGFIWIKDEKIHL